jgi:hypothetical protein
LAAQGIPHDVSDWHLASFPCRDEIRSRSGHCGLWAAERSCEFNARKANPLSYEFEEIGMNRQLGYTSAADLIDKYPAFYWNSVAEHLDAATTYFSATVSGQQWIAHLHNNVFCAEHSCRLIGPQS